MITFEDASKLQMRKFLQEEWNAKRLFYTVKEGQMTSGNKIELKQSKKRSRATCI